MGSAHSWLDYSQFSSVAQLGLTLCDPMDYSTPGLPVHHQLQGFTQTHAHWVRDAIQPPHLLFLLLPPSIFPSISIFSNDSILHIMWQKYWSFSFSISPSNEYSGLISFWIDWFDLPAVQETLKSLLQHHSLKESILRHSAFFMVQLSHLHMFLYIFFNKLTLISSPLLFTWWVLDTNGYKILSNAFLYQLIWFNVFLL